MQTFGLLPIRCLSIAEIAKPAEWSAVIFLVARALGNQAPDIE